ncbi:acyl-CoA thioesterase [Sulfolobus sp. A20-N-G8]|nr:acyl-CoA thioesterase [Sulfolobus sp. A20-N-G8]
MFKLENYYSVLPWHVNHFNSLHGGIYMSWLIDTGGLLMSNISRGNYVLASLDYLYLYKSGRLGDVLRIIAEATAWWKSSVEIKVKACLKKGEKEEVGAISLMTFVAVDETGRPRNLSIPPKYDEEAEKRRERRLKRKIADMGDQEDLVPFTTFSRSYIRTIYPEHAFTSGILYAGKMYTMLDEALAIVAKIYSRGNVLTVSAGNANFLIPVRIGDILEIQGAVEYVGNTSIDVGAKVFSIDYRKGEKKLVTKTVFSFVSVDDEGKPKTLPKFTPSSEKEKKLLEARLVEREERLRISKALREEIY